MSKQNLEKVLRQELETLNDKIDEKIIKGLPYKMEARRHKFILNSLAEINTEGNSSSWFTRPLNTFSII